jgi:hypothetical protein
MVLDSGIQRLGGYRKIRVSFFPSTYVYVYVYVYVCMYTNKNSNNYSALASRYGGIVSACGDMDREIESRQVLVWYAGSD